MMIMAQHPQQRQQQEQQQNQPRSQGAAVAQQNNAFGEDGPDLKRPTGAAAITCKMDLTRTATTQVDAARKAINPATNNPATTSSNKPNAKVRPSTQEVSTCPKQDTCNSVSTYHQQEQDGKRTLIKNQLYLIEQLQLENANLRNERDQLQLENEELKFQLQMIR